MNDNSVTLRLGVEEVLFLLKALKIETLPGLGDNPVNGLSEDQVIRAVAAGLNSLVARGWVNMPAGGDQPLTIESALIAAFSVCAAATRVLFVSRQAVDGTARALYVHAGQHTLVNHRLVSAGVHQFVVNLTAEAALAEAAEVLNLAQQGRPAAAGLSLTQATLDHAGALLKDGKRDEARKLLQAQGAPSDPAAQFLDTLASFKASALITLLTVGAEQTAGAPPAQGFTLMEGANGLWQLQPKDDVSMTVEPVTAEDARKRIAALFAGPAK